MLNAENKIIKWTERSTNLSEGPGYINEVLFTRVAIAAAAAPAEEEEETGFNIIELIMMSDE
jgi:hypothetical protein